MKSKYSIHEESESTVIIVGNYTFTYPGVTIKEMLNGWTKSDFTGCTSDQDGSVVFDPDDDFMDFLATI